MLRTDILQGLTETERIIFKRSMNKLKDKFPTATNEELEQETLKAVIETRQEIAAEQTAGPVRGERTPVPDQIRTDNTRLSKILMDKDTTITNGKVFQVSTFPKQKIPTRVVFTDTTIEIGKRISPNITRYQMLLHDIACSFWEKAQSEGQECYFTSDQVQEMLSGGRKQGRITPQQKASITKGFNKLFGNMIKIDYAEAGEIANKSKTRAIIVAENDRQEAYKISKVEAGMLQFERMTLVSTRNGKEIEVYHLIAEPRLLTYSKILGHTYQVPLEEYAVESLSVSEENRALISYLIYRAVYMQNGANSNIILFEEAMAAAGMKRGKIEDNRNRKTFIKILDHLKEVGRIMDYEKVYNRQSWDKVKLTVKKRTREKAIKEKNT